MHTRIRVAPSALLLTFLAASTLSFAAERSATVGVAQASVPFDRFTQRIVGGAPSGPGNRTYQVRTSPGCGGTILNDNWILTAAHCGRPRWVRAGVYDLSTTQGTQYTVAEYVEHPSFNSPKQFSNDFALVRINGTFNSTLTRALLPNATVTAAVGKAGDLVVVSGWGALSEGGGSPNVLHEVTIPIVSDAVCSASNSYGTRLDGNTMLCAGPAAGGKDSCQGDSGGPLVAFFESKAYNLGVVSWGDGCARPNKFGVYSETAKVVDWIRSKIGGTTPPPPTGQTYSNGTDVAISDNTTVESAIAVSGRTGNGSATTPVAVNIVHTYIGDLKVDLIAPDGSLYVLHNRAGGGTDNINRTYTVNLSSEPLNGTWRLRVNDNANVDVGRIDSWSVTF